MYIYIYIYIYIYKKKICVYVRYNNPKCNARLGVARVGLNPANQSPLKSLGCVGRAPKPQLAPKTGVHIAVRSHTGPNYIQGLSTAADPPPPEPAKTSWSTH